MLVMSVVTMFVTVGEDVVVVIADSVLVLVVAVVVASLVLVLLASVLPPVARSRELGLIVGRETLTSLDTDHGQTLVLDAQGGGVGREEGKWRPDCCDVDDETRDCDETDEEVIDADVVRLTDAL